MKECKTKFVPGLTLYAPVDPPPVPKPRPVVLEDVAMFMAGELPPFDRHPSDDVYAYLLGCCRELIMCYGRGGNLNAEGLLTMLAAIGTASRSR